MKSSLYPDTINEEYIFGAKQELENISSYHTGNQLVDSNAGLYVEKLLYFLENPPKIDLKKS